MAVDPKHLKTFIRETLNEELIKKRKLSKEKIEYLVDLNVEKHNIYREMRGLTEAKELRELSAQVTEINYLIQATWGFEQDKKYHKFWELPGCQCPVFSNIAKYPSGDYEYMSTCPIHGSKYKE